MACSARGRGSVIGAGAVAAVAYFLLVFGAGFVLGPVRVLWLVPRVGPRWAELLELPVMVAVMVWASRWTTARFAVRPGPTGLVMGVAALGLVLLAEFSLVLRLRGLSLAEYFATRDPVAAAAYYGSLVLYGLLPYLWAGFAVVIRWDEPRKRLGRDFLVWAVRTAGDTLVLVACGRCRLFGISPALKTFWGSPRESRLKNERFTEVKVAGTFTFP